MKKILTVLLVLIAAICTAFAFGACDLNDLFGTGDNGDTATDDSTPSDDSGDSDSTADGGSDSVIPDTNIHTCVFVFTEKVVGCVTQGYNLFTCNDPACGKTEKHNFTDPVGHDFKHTTFKATCTSDSAEADICARCGAEQHRITFSGTMLSHDYSWTQTKAATCTMDGEKTGVCRDCGDTTTDVIPLLNHNFVNYVSNNDADCTKDETETAECTRCGDKDTQTISGTKLPHNLGAYVSNNDATCTKDGTETAVCADCSYKDTQTISGSKLGHNYVASNINNYAATCERDGKETKICTNCKDVVSRDIPATGHKYENDVCKNCGLISSSLSGGLIIADRGTYCEVIGIGTASGNVVIPETYNGKPVTDIGWVFNGYVSDDVNDKLTGLVIPDSVTKIWADGCYGCANLETVVIGSGVTELVYNAFGGCTKLKTITFGTSITSIQEGAFGGCTSVDTIIFNGTKAQWNAITKESGWDSSFGSYTVKCTDGNI